MEKFLELRDLTLSEISRAIPLISEQSKIVHSDFPPTDFELIPNLTTLTLSVHYEL